MELNVFYLIAFTKNRNNSLQLRVLPTCKLYNLLMTELDVPSVEFATYKKPFWRLGNELWLEVVQAVNLSSSVDKSNVIFIISDGSMRCYFKKTQPFQLSHYVNVSRLDELAKSKPDAKTLKAIHNIQKLKNHPTATQQRAIENIVNRINLKNQ